jgi:hypothetical protein
VLLDDHATGPQTEAVPADDRCHIARAMERLEDPWQLVSRYSGAYADHLEDGPGLAIDVLGRHTYGAGLTGWSVLHRVCNQIFDDPRNAVGISPAAHFRLSRVEAQLMLAVLGVRLDHLAGEMVEAQVGATRSAQPSARRSGCPVSSLVTSSMFSTRRTDR